MMWYPVNQLIIDWIIFENQKIFRIFVYVNFEQIIADVDATFAQMGTKSCHYLTNKIVFGYMENFHRIAELQDVGKTPRYFLPNWAGNIWNFFNDGENSALLRCDAVNLKMSKRVEKILWHWRDYYTRRVLQQIWRKKKFQRSVFPYRVTRGLHVFFPFMER